MSRYHTYQVKEVTEAIACMAWVNCAWDEVTQDTFHPDVRLCTRDFISNLNTLIREMNNVFYLRLSN